MKLSFCWLAVFTALCVSTSGREEVNRTMYNTMGFGLELLLTKFDIISSKLQRVEDNLKSMEDKMQKTEIKILQKVDDKIQEHRTIQQQLVAEFHEFRSSQNTSQSEMLVELHALEKRVAVDLNKYHDNAREHRSAQGDIVAAFKEHREIQVKSEKEIIAVLLKLENQFADNFSKLHDNIQDHRSSQTKNNKELFAAIQKLEHEAALNLSQVNNQNQENINVVLRKLDQDIEHVLHKQYSQTTLSSCKKVPLYMPGGTYLLRVKSGSEPFEVYCEQKSFGGGWIVFQYRFDGSLDFYRGWNEFRDGFGDLNKEFWLGLEKLHQITRGRKHELIVELKDFNGTYKYARYDAFEIGSESDKYKLKDIGKYNGTAGDAMSYDKGDKFSTKDRDNDAWPVLHCAQEREGAGWYAAWGCAQMNLNGRYMNAIDRKSMHWHFFNNNYHGLSYSRMMIRELE